MMRKQHLYFLFAILFFTIGFDSLYAQEQLVQKGDRLFKNKEFALAADYYEKYLKNTDNFEIDRKLAVCYAKTNNDLKAIEIYERIIENPFATPDDYLHYANLLKSIRDYKEAKVWYQKYADSNPKDKNISNLILSCNLINELKNNDLYITKPINVNSPQSDFASAFYKNGLVFVSGRFNKTSKKIDGRTREYFLDLYYSEKNDDNFMPPIQFSEEFNTKYHEGPACFTANERFIYFSRNKKSVNLDGKSELQIYSARSNGKNWDKPELFQFSDLVFSMGHPSISSNGRYLYLISNMEGGYGGTDIYVCQKQGFVWSRPINLGPTINTSGNEMFPFIANDGYLYFASDGHIGFGGLDIFKSIFQQNEWTYPVNLGPPFNSSKDDFGYIVKKNKKLGYFSSNRTGNDDIYEFNQNPEKIVNLKGRILANTNKERLKNVEVILMDNLSREKSTISDENGFFNFDIFQDKNYSLIVTKPGYKTKRILYFPRTSQPVPKQLNIAMEQTAWVKLKGSIVDQFSARGIENASIEIINQTYKSNSLCQSDRYGDFEQDIDPSKSYNIIIQKKGYFTKKINNYRYQSDKFEQIELQKFNRNQNMELYGVVFEDSSTNLTESTIDELDNLVGLLLVNPHIAIEISSYLYTDRGKKENKTLSENRARAASEYIVSKGITANRVQYKAGGHNPEKPALTVKLIEAF